MIARVLDTTGISAAMFYAEAMVQINAPLRVGDVRHGGRPSRRGTDRRRQQVTHAEPGGAVEQDCVAVREIVANCRRIEFFNLRYLRSPPGVRLAVLCVVLIVGAGPTQGEPTERTQHGVPARPGFPASLGGTNAVRHGGRSSTVETEAATSPIPSFGPRRPQLYHQLVDGPATSLSTGGALTMLPTSLARDVQNSGWIDRSIVNSFLKLLPVGAGLWGARSGGGVSARLAGQMLNLLCARPSLCPVLLRGQEPRRCHGAPGICNALSSSAAGSNLCAEGGGSGPRFSVGCVMTVGREQKKSERPSASRPRGRAFRPICNAFLNDRRRRTRSARCTSSTVKQLIGRLPR
jgi:hypothetical protein